MKTINYLTYVFKAIFSAVILTTFSTFITLCDIPTNEMLFQNKNILILGGTGYLGRCITEHVLKYNPREVCIFSRDEVKHFRVKNSFKNQNVKTLLGDIRDYDCLERAMHGVDIVFHVAALKRMDSLETHVQEAIKTNILGSVNVFKAAIKNNVKKVLFISTDKACSPINTYGACKFVSEKIFTNYDREKIKTKFIVTRFGNILESTGSVIPIFIDLIKSGSEITLTDERMTRFIISKEQAVALIFDALRFGVGGEIFLKRLPAMKIPDLIVVLKKRYQKDNSVRTIGLRPGEKLHEVLINESELARSYKFNDYFIITPSISTNTEEIPIYITRRKLNLGLSKEYSSDQEVITAKSLGELFSELNLLT